MKLLRRIRRAAAEVVSYVTIGALLLLVFVLVLLGRAIR